MKHILPYPILEAKEINPNQQEFVAQLKKKFEELGIPWRNLAPSRAQKMGAVYLHLSPKEAWQFITTSGWDQWIGKSLTKKAANILKDARDSGVIDGLADSPVGREFYVYIQSSSMRGESGHGKPSSNRIYEFVQGADGAKGPFQYWLLRELYYHVRSKKFQLISSTSSPEVYRKYARDPDSNVRSLLARQANLPEDVILTLSRDRSDAVQSALLDAGRLPAQAILNLAKSNVYWIKLTLVNNYDLPEEVLSRFSKDPESRVRRAVAKHPNTATELLIQLSRDANPEVSQAAKASLKPRQEEELKGYGWSDDEIELARKLGL